MDVLHVDCQSCVARGPACGDCVISVLLGSPPQGVDRARYQPGGYLKKLENDPWGNPYLYASPGRNSEFDLWSHGRDGKEGGEGPDADITSWQ